MENSAKVKILFTDFDGTLFTRKRAISEEDVRILQWLGREGIVRVIATGRSYFSIRKVIPANFPVDYIILSSGAGIMEWPGKQLLKTHVISGRTSDRLIDLFRKHKLSFFVHNPLPDNHHFYYFGAKNVHADFNRRLALYADFAQPLALRPSDQPSSQFLLINTNLSHVRSFIRPYASRLNIIKATSPLDGKSLWVEIFAAGVSKQHAGQWLCHRLNIAQANTLAIGNDYNDVDLLRWCARSYVVPEAPQELLKTFTCVTGNDSVLRDLFPFR